jgi:hypothetical protein
MALAHSAWCFFLVLIIFLITVAFGSRVLEIARLISDQPLDNVLFSSGIGFATLQLLLGIVGLSSGLAVRSVVVSLVLIAVASGRGWKSAFRLSNECCLDLARVFESGGAKALGISIFFFLAFEALISTAPLSGSDAMHYHFAVPLLQMGRPERPIFWLTHSFFLGLGHELIGLGLVLEGDTLALLLIFFAGCLTAAALFQLARRLMPLEWALATVLTFLMTPMVFWQISTAGSPDIWMGFFAVLAVLALERMPDPSSRNWQILASAYAGAGASIKYTGWVLPAVIVLAVLWFTKSFLWAALCSATAVAVGALPLVRNFLWTGDPFFPFLNRWIGRIAANPYGFAATQADVHSHLFSYQPLHILVFLTAMVLKGADYGLGNYFGPVVLAFLPLLLFCNWRTRLTWVSGVLWLSMLFANTLTSQMARFLLPAYPFALALVFSGAAVASLKWGTIVRVGCAATLAVFGLFSLASDTFYGKDFLPVSLGIESKEAFLERMAPDYQAAKFVNSELANREGNTLLFLRHLYYLTIPYINGDPNTSWTMDPAVLTSPQAVLTFLKDQNIHWIVKSPGYPRGLAGVFEECEKEGMLIPEAQGEVEAFEGNSRIFERRLKVHIVLIRVAN